MVSSSGITKTGTGTLVLASSTNNFVSFVTTTTTIGTTTTTAVTGTNYGVVTESTGTLALANDNALSTASIALTSGTPGPTLQLLSDTNGDTFNSRGLIISGSNGTTTIDVSSLTGSGLAGTQLNISGTISLGSDTLGVTSSNGYVLGLNGLTLTGSTVTIAPTTGSVLITGSITGGTNLNLAGSGTGTIAGPGITNLAGTVALNGSGLWVFAASGTYKGPTNLTSGTLGIAVDSTPITAGLITNGPIGTGALNFNGGTLIAFGGNHTIANVMTTVGANAGTISGANNITLNGLLTVGGNTSLAINTAGLTTFGGGINLNGDTLTLTGSGNLAVNSAITGGTGSLVWNNAGVFTVTSTNSTYTGTTTLSKGTVQFGNGITADGQLNATALVNNGSLVINTMGTQNYIQQYQRDWFDHHGRDWHRDLEWKQQWL